MKRLLVLLAMLVVCLGVSAKQQQQDVQYNIIYIGNSITYGALHANRDKTAPPVVATARVSKMIKQPCAFSNCGRSGATTVDFLPSMNHDFKRVEKAIANHKEDGGADNEKFIFSIMLGTNDSASTGPTGAPVSNEDYKKNLLAIIGRCRELCPNAIFVLQRPVWYSPNTYNGARYLVAGLNRVTDYVNVLVEVANENKDVYIGDCDSYELFKNKYTKYMFAEPGNAGTFYLHPNEAGVAKMANNWAKAIAEAVEASVQ